MLSFMHLDLPEEETQDLPLTLGRGHYQLLTTWGFVRTAMHMEEMLLYFFPLMLNLSPGLSTQHRPPLEAGATGKTHVCRVRPHD